MSRQSAGDRIPWGDRTVQVVLASTLLAPLGVPLVAPALPVVRDAFALSDAQASLLVSAYFLVGIVVSPFLGLLADRVGRKRVLVPALVGFSLAGVAGYLAPDYATLLALRAIQGTAAAALFVTTVTIVGDAFEGAQRNAILGANVAVLSVGAAVFPVVGGALAAVAWNAPFLAYGLALPIALFAAWGLEDVPDGSDVPDDPDESSAGSAASGDQVGDRAGYLRGAARSLTPAMAGLLAAAFLTEFLLFGALITVVPFLLTAAYGLAPLFVGLIVTTSEVGAIASASASGRLAGVFTNGRLIGLGFVSYGFGLVGVYAAPSPAFVALAALLFGVGLGLSMPAVDAAVSERVTREYRAGLLGLRNSTTFLGRAAGPVVFATAAAAVGYRPVLAVSAVGVLVVAVGAVVVTRKPVERAGTEPVA
jgi:MFS family permease